MKVILHIFLVLFMLGIASNSFAMGEGCGAGDCKDCHNLTHKEAKAALKEVAGNVIDVKFSEVPGLWEVAIEQQGQKIPVYLDFSKQFLISGRVIRLATREDVTKRRFMSLNKVDVSLIPLDDAIIIGNPEAANKIIVFDDPECAYCKKLHPEMIKLAEQRKDIAFFIKMFPLVKIHPTAYDKAKAIICEKSAQLLQDSLDGKELPPPSCETDQVDKNLELGKKLSIKSTPTLIFPTGVTVPGFVPAEKIAEILAETSTEKETEKKAEQEGGDKKAAANDS